MRIVFFLTALLLALASPRAHAFMNIEQLRQTNKSGTAGAVGVKINGQTGNSKKLLSEITTLTMQRNGASEYILAGLYRYGQSRSVKDTHLGNAHLRYTHHFENFPAAETFFQTEFDQFKRLARRDLIGAGLRFLLERTEGNALNVGTGFFRENERFSDNLAGQHAYRANLYVSFVRAFNERISGNAVIYFQPSLHYLRDMRAQVDTALQVKLARFVGLSLEWSLQLDTLPPPAVQKVDTNYMVGLNFTY